MSDRCICTNFVPTLLTPVADDRIYMYCANCNATVSCANPPPALSRPSEFTEITRSLLLRLRPVEIESRILQQIGRNCCGAEIHRTVNRRGYAPADRILKKHCLEGSRSRRPSRDL